MSSQKKNDCLRLGFNYILRVKNNSIIEIGNKKLKIADLPREKDDIEIVLSRSKTKTRMIISFADKESQGWYIVTNLEQESYEELILHYKQRFHCEKMFQDQKSSIFDIENSKVEEYSRFSNLFFSICFTQMLTMLVGKEIDKNYKKLKKK